LTWPDQQRNDRNSNQVSDMNNAKRASIYFMAVGVAFIAMGVASIAVHGTFPDIGVNLVVFIGVGAIFVLFGLFRYRKIAK
jgi:hypothetical protein